MKGRILALDGLRAFAVLGVIWAHVWMFYGAISLKIGRIDIHRIISFGGIGVDLFFVISGFCMYLIFEKKALVLSGEGYGEFVFRRWKRLAPAFYFVVLVECMLYFLSQGHFPLESFVAHIFFVNTFIPDSDNVLSPSFWSLATEWQFYILLPFIFIGYPQRNKLIRRVIIMMLICIICRIFLFHHYMGYLKNGITVPSDKIWYRFVEFGWGILAARIYLDKTKFPILNGNAGFMLSAASAFAGRLLMVTEVANAFGPLSFFVRALGEPVLTFGFALVIINVTGASNFFVRILSLPFMQFIGRISYSMYLWHWLICWNITHWIIGRAGQTPLIMNLTYIVCLIAIIPISWVTYRLLEVPYFTSGKRLPASAI